MAVRTTRLKKSNHFPRLAKKSNKVTSNPDKSYNCIAYAVGRTDKKIWPSHHPDHYWPPGIDRGNGDDLAGLLNLFASHGYVRCVDAAYVEGVEKVAIYTLASGRPTHAARQIGANRWASKLGEWYDIEHSEKAVSGGDYGEIAIFMQRQRPA
jgi:hypothetical protein